MTILTPFRSESLMERFFDDWESQTVVHTPEIQVKKSDNAYKVRTKLPGVKKDDIKIEVENGYLKISGKYENKEEKEEKDYESVHSEFRSYSEFQRVLSLDLARFDTDNIDASFEDGLLEITLALKEVEKPKQITIKKAS